MTQSEKDSLYREAYVWLSEQGIIRGPYGCDCPECNYHIDRYFS